MILDDMVLDVTDFKNHHPGGKFLIEHNVGRDISKFFYGGYAMENFNGKPNNFKHPNLARIIVNSLITAKLEKSAPTFHAQIVKRTKINSNTQTITYEGHNVVPGLK